jgi:dipeptidyl aminopeptidase/acylaminoacyl peptidase
VNENSVRGSLLPRRFRSGKPEERAAMSAIHRISVAVLSALFVASPGSGTALAGDWTPEAMLSVKQVGAVQVSPDGKRVAFVVSEAFTAGDQSEFRSQIHVALSEDGKSFQLTRGDESALGPQWTPDGERIAFLRKVSGKAQVWVIHLHGGEAEPLTKAEGGVTGFRWSPDGSNLAYTAVDSTPKDRQEKIKAKDDARVVGAWHARNRLYLIGTNGEKDRREARGLIKGELSVAGETSPQFDWSPDGKSIVFAHVPTADADDWTRGDISIVEVSSGTVRPLAQTRRAEASPFFSPDGTRVAYAASDDPPSWAFDSSVYVVPAGGGEPRKLAETFDHRPELLGWSADGSALLYRENRGTTTRVFALPLTGEPRGLGPQDGVVSEASLNASRTSLGFSFQKAEKPVEAYLCRLDHSEAVQVSRTHDNLPARPVGKTEVIRWRSSDDKEIEGLLTYPAGYERGKRCPLLLLIHGGPAGVFTQTFTGSPVSSTSGSRHATSTYPIAAFAARGFAVLRCNVRGSSGYGKDFRHANTNDWGGGDFKDLMAGVDEVISRGVADPTRLGVMGWSYGGYMTSWVIGHTGRFKAASVGAAVTDLVSFSGTSDIHSFLPSYFGGEPWERAGDYREHSPIAHIKGVKTPALIQHGEDDERVPIGQGYELYDALKRQACTVEMVVYPRAHHSIQEPKLLLDAMRRNLAWFEKYVSDGNRREP